MELKITELQLPGKIAFNYADLKRELTEKVAEYGTLVYTESQIRDAKADRASLNRLKKALNDERIRQEKEFMKPFAEFKAQVQELCGIVDTAASTIDNQIKAFENAQKQKKAEQIKAYWDSKDTPEWMRRENPKWLNASYSMQSIIEEIDCQLSKIQKDIDTLDGMGVCFEAIQKYQSTLDLAQAIAENSKIKAEAEEKAKWEAEHGQMQITPPEPPAPPAPEAPKASQQRSWIGFQALLTVQEAKALGKYLRERGIQYKSI